MTTLTLGTGERIHVRIDGEDSAPVVVLSNSLGAALEMWDPIAGRLAEHFRVVRYDSRGHGRSSTPEGEYLLTDLAADVIGILDALEVDRADVVGISVGGQTALAAALEHPDRVRRVVAANTGAKIGTEQTWAERAAKVRAEGLASIADTVLAGWLTPPFAAEHPEVLARMRELFLANDPEGYAATCHALAHSDLRPHLAEIAVPTLVIAATGDVPTPPSLTREIAEGIPGAAYTEIPGAHISVAESPDEFADAVLAHLLTGDGSPAPQP